MNDENGTDVDTQFLDELRARVAERRARVDALEAQLQALKPELRRYESALRLLSGEQVDTAIDKPRQSRSKGVKTQSGTSIGPERLEAIERAVREYARDHEEFRQVDVRAVYDMTSSVSATAFEILRQRNVLRVARVDGNSKFYRLTREAIEA